MHYRVFLFLLNFIGFYHVANAQDSAVLKGIIRYENEPQAKATILFKGANEQFISDSAGYFEITGLHKGKHQLFITMVGFESQLETVNIDHGEVKTITVELQKNNSSLNEVVVTGTMKPVTKLKSPIAVEVFTPQYFKKNPSPSIFESLQMVNGVRPQINCSVCNTGDIHINGLEGPYSMVTIDGMPIVSSLSSVYGLFGIPNQLVEKIEIIKGPASGLYGSEAIGGLINIITKSPEKAPTFSFNALTTSWLEHNIDVGVKMKVGKATSLLGLNYFNYANKQDRNNDNFTDVTLQHRISLFNKWNFERKHNRVTTLAARYFYEDRWGGDMRWNKSFRGGDSLYGESIYTKRFEAIGNYQLPVEENMFFSFSATSHNQNSYYGAIPYLGDQKIAFGQLIWNKSLGKHFLLAGAAGRYNYYDDNSTATRDTVNGKNAPDKNFIPGIFLQEEWELNQKNRLLVGVRVDHHPVHKAIVTPRVAYKWNINDKQVFRLNAGTGFRVVNLFTEDHAALTGSRIVEIKNKLKPEESYNINLNYSRQFGGNSNSFGIDASVWYTYFHNQIVADYTTDPNKIIYDNLSGHAISKGLSLNLEFNFMQRLRGSAGLTLQDVATINKNNLGKEIKQRPMLSENASGTWAITYAFPVSGITIDYTGNVYGPMRLPLISDLDPRRAYSPVWSIQNIQFTKWMSNKVELFGGIKNFLNWTPAKNNAFLIARSHDPFDKKVEYNSDGSIMQTEENPYKLTFDPTYVYAPNQGMRVFAGMRFKMK
jgi:outer membrane receptor for ferrienterochelin and colicins